MKNLKLIIFALAFFVSTLSYAQLAEPGDGGGGVDGAPGPVGGGAPVGSGLFILIGFGAIYGGNKVYSTINDGEEIL